MKIEFTQGRAALGQVAARAIANALRTRIADRGNVTVVFAAAPSQNETLAALEAEPDIAWETVTAFHMDEYAGADPDSAYSFRRYLREHLLDRVNVGVFHPIRGEAEDLRAECERYAALLPSGGFDVALLGIGENGHIAFNDPPCDFADKAAVRLVTLDAACRAQQVHDGAFASLGEVPELAITLTVPALMASREVLVMAPGPNKAAAVAAAIDGPLTNECPASILRTHSRATLFLDSQSAGLLRRV
jgi:glucosamine-6-phosphate deaminase